MNPSYYAVTSKASLHIVILSIYVFIVTFEYYYMSPIDEYINLVAFLDVDKLINTFLKICLLEMLGVSELMNLKGFDV